MPTEIESPSFEINRTAAALGRDGRVVRLTPEQARDAVAAIIKAFVEPGDWVWWWEHFTVPSSYLIDEHGTAYQRLTGLVPSPRDQCYLVVEVDDGHPVVFLVAPEDIGAMLGECSAFEYYLVSMEFDWLLCENHHGALIGCGHVRAALERAAA